MTIRSQMIASLSRGKSLLADSEPLVVDFLKASVNPDGGFRGRSDKSDLYYTVFGLEVLSALGEPLASEQTLSFLDGFADLENLDLIHLASLIRCYANLTQGRIENSLRERLVNALERFRCEVATVYECFFALGAYHDLGVELPNQDDVIKCIGRLCVSAGGFTNNSSIPVGSTNATAAAMITLHHLGEKIDNKHGDWLLNQCTDSGGFVAVAGAPMPDLLSTATSVHALSVTGFKIDSIKEKTLDFVDSLWTSKGSFHANRADKTIDCEYTYYGLLALGHLGN
ncbi:prenyltransferase/squalene oxidase repeat-containing protein [Planctomycetota bacterium]